MQSPWRAVARASVAAANSMHMHVLTLRLEAITRVPKKVVYVLTVSESAYT